MSDEVVSALKHFRCDACDRLKRLPIKKKSGGESRRDLQRHCIHGCEFLENLLQGISSCEEDNAGVEHRGFRIRYAYCYSDCRSHCRDHLEGVCDRCLRAVPPSSQVARGLFDKAEGRGIFVAPTPAEAHWQMGQVENNARYLRQIGF